jgi:hypothetical protein
MPCWTPTGRAKPLRPAWPRPSDRGGIFDVWFETERRAQGKHGKQHGDLVLAPALSHARIGLLHSCQVAERLEHGAARAWCIRFEKFRLMR